MKKQKKNAKKENFKLRRLTAKRLQIINKIRKKVILEANKKLREDIERCSHASS